jgi:hypothetical protein
MEKKPWSVHSVMEETKILVQNQKNKRSQSDKIGRLPPQNKKLNESQ